MTVPPALTPADMAAIGAELGVLRPDTCTIKRPTGSRDRGGAPTTTASDVATVDCRVMMAGTATIERIMGGRFAPAADHIIAIPLGTDVANDDVVERASDGRRFDVIYVPRPSFAFEINVACRATS